MRAENVNLASKPLRAMSRPYCWHTLVSKHQEDLLTPEEKARESIDGMLASAGWLIQNRADADIDAGRGVAIREFALGHGFGDADYLLFVAGQAAGVIEAKRKAQPSPALKSRPRSTARAFQRLSQLLGVHSPSFIPLSVHRR